MLIAEKKSTHCYHCGEPCKESVHMTDGHSFCCTGCETVYGLLKENNLCTYYKIDASPGQQPTLSPQLEGKFQFLEEESIQKQLIDFADATRIKVNFFVPSIHCSSCIWLLEHLHKLNPGILESRTDFLKKTISITYHPQETTLRQVVELLASLGYEPQLKLHDLVKNQQKSESHSLAKKLAVAGFCAGNTMMFSFPEYLGLDKWYEGNLASLFSYLNVALSLPVVFYSGWGYVESSYKSLRKGVINLDFPILLGILVTFGRSLYEVFSGTGTGYFDSLSGLVFFLLIGKWYQSKTFDYLSFERDFKSFFPLVSLVRREGKETTVPVMDIKPGDTLIVRNHELIPADAILTKGDASIDYSFITGESIPVAKSSGELIYAGGKQIGTRIELTVTKATSQSYLTQLWNHHAKEKDRSHGIVSFTDKVGHYFTYGILALSVFVLVFWGIQNDWHRGWTALTTLLIVACPCALGLSSPVALGNAIRILGKNKFYLKNSEVVEKLARTETFVFDKTGTLTQGDQQKVHFVGHKLSSKQMLAIHALASQSHHPLARAIQGLYETISLAEVEHFHETKGKGMEGWVVGQYIVMGSAAYVQESISEKDITNQLQTRVYVSIDGFVLGYFQFEAHYREGIEEVVKSLGQRNDLYLLSGDSAGEKNRLSSIFPANHMHFNCKPEDKMHFVSRLQNQGHTVAMVGDGLNDAGALNISHVGISVTEDISNFSPACDVIVESRSLQRLPQFVSYCKSSIWAIRLSFIISLTYNMIGLSFAAWGNLSPVVAAILMPASSVSMVLFASSFTYISAKIHRIL